MVGRHPDVVGVELIGSRARGEETALSDWDFQIHTTNVGRLVADLPTLVSILEPLAAQWDPLVERAVYMLVLPGPAKVDLFPGDERRGIQPPWRPTQENLVAIDAHFWDWILWLGGKVLGGQTELVDEELNKLQPRRLLDVAVVDVDGESLVGAYLRYIEGCDLVVHNTQLSK